jgi:3-oxoacyl-[acyl-carrier-protein] synthase II
MFNLGGYRSITTACSSSATAIGWGADLVATGRLKAVLCGGSDALSILTFAGFNSLRVVDTEPCAPFSLGRRGISLGEGAAFFVLEEETEAKARGANIYGYVLGYAVAGEAYHMTAPEPTGVEAARVMADAVKMAGVNLSDVGWVNAHGTATPLNDVVETKAMKLVFGDRVGEVPLVSTKALTDTVGATGAIEALATVVALRQGQSRDAQFQGADPECDLEYCHGGSATSSAGVALSNSFAFGAIAPGVGDMNDNHDKIAVTGLAAISSAGVGTEPLLEAIKDGRSRLQPVPEEITGETGHFWGRAEGFKVSDFMPRSRPASSDRCSLFAIVAAGMAPPICGD